jgi:hypothetical protein
MSWPEASSPNSGSRRPATALPGTRRRRQDEPGRAGGALLAGTISATPPPPPSSCSRSASHACSSLKRESPGVRTPLVRGRRGSQGPGAGPRPADERGRCRAG